MTTYEQQINNYVESCRNSNAYSKLIIDVSMERITLLQEAINIEERSIALTEKSITESLDALEKWKIENSPCPQ